ncbi:hypothetical protein IMZ29_09540 [Achromobacter sp. GG226]|uniref:DUF6389 family protein n=1 Tax=Verticiella alkaliphila TaxID=2779529 RepID=UPI001C0D1501|nr:DUF6389 family protein [Verticiella sp. GG226]MBU4610763.1 hypothetical protein [Verticiella sp. GG226]
MNRDDYIAALQAVLAAHDAAAEATLVGLFAALPPRAQEIHIVVHPDQDGEGTFSVVASLSGPDLFVLNKAIEGHRYLFDVRHTAEGLWPEVPYFAHADAAFSVQDAIVDTAMAWVAARWAAVAPGRTTLPGWVYGEEGYGTTDPLALPA